MPKVLGLHRDPGSGGWSSRKLPRGAHTAPLPPAAACGLLTQPGRPGGLRGPLLTAAELIKGDVKTGWGEGEGENNGPDLLMWVFLPPVFACEALCILAAQAFLGCVIIFGCLLMHQFLPAAFQVRSQRTRELPAPSLCFHLPVPIPSCPPQQGRHGWGCAGRGAPLLAALPGLVLLRAAAAR